VAQQNFKSVKIVNAESGARDRLGRPLRGDIGAAFPQVPDQPKISDIEAWNQAMEYLNQDLPFHVHEVCEQRWRCAPDESKNTWRALAQWGAALTHAARGNQTGARALGQRASENLADATNIPATIDLELVRTSLAQLSA
jgi:uncharacterized protein